MSENKVSTTSTVTMFFDYAEVKRMLTLLVQRRAGTRPEEVFKLTYMYVEQLQRGGWLNNLGKEYPDGRLVPTASSNFQRISLWIDSVRNPATGLYKRAEGAPFPHRVNSFPMSKEGAWVEESFAELRSRGIMPALLFSKGHTYGDVVKGILSCAAVRKEPDYLVPSDQNLIVLHSSNSLDDQLLVDQNMVRLVFRQTSGIRELDGQIAYAKLLQSLCAPKYTRVPKSRSNPVSVQELLMTSAGMRSGLDAQTEWKSLAKATQYRALLKDLGIRKFKKLVTAGDCTLQENLAVLTYSMEPSAVTAMLSASDNFIGRHSAADSDNDHAIAQRKTAAIDQFLANVLAGFTPAPWKLPPSVGCRKFPLS